VISHAVVGAALGDAVGEISGTSLGLLDRDKVSSVKVSSGMRSPMVPESPTGSSSLSDSASCIDGAKV